MVRFIVSNFINGKVEHKSFRRSRNIHQRRDNMKRCKKLICLLLAAVLTLSVLTVPSQAAGGEVDLGDVVELGDFELLHGYVIFYPKELETSDKTYPVAVWANGTMCAPVLYTDLLKKVAAKGFVVVASSDTMAADGTAQCNAIDYIFDESMKEDSVFAGKLDPNRIAAFGHSQGGRSSVNAAVLDDRIGCVVSIAGSNYTSEAAKLSTPTLFLTGTADLVVLSSMWVKPAFNKCTGPAVYASLKDAIHTTCMLAPDKYVDYIASWFDAWLNGNKESMQVFSANGTLKNDPGWKDFASNKYMNASLAGSVFGEGNIWMAVSIAEALAIAALAVVLVMKKKKVAE